MKVLLVGGGGREHALAWKFVREQPSLELIAAPGNPGIATLGRCLPVSGTDIDGLVKLALAEKPDLVVVGPEAPLAAGLVNRLREHRVPAFGPTREAAEVESSKAFSKQMMEAAGVPTAHATICTTQETAHAAVAAVGAPVVIKASGLAAGKGVFVCTDEKDAHAAIDELMGAGSMGEAGSTVLVEEFMEGEEVSLFAITDGSAVLPMLPVQDHKRLLDGDEGPNTGGMGAYAPVSVGGPTLVGSAVRTVFHPMLAALREHGRPFTGLLYAGLMLTGRGIRVVEFNCRFGDPETQCILPLMRSSLLDPMLAVASGDGLAGASPLEWSSESSVTTVVATGNYPAGSQTGLAISVPVLPDGVEIFHSGTAEKDGQLLTAGGRVLSVTAVRAAFEDAQRTSREVAASVRFQGAQFRRDIGWREAARHARAS